MTETLHWYAETSGGVRQGDAPVHPGCGAVHLSADLPAGTLKAVRAEMPWTMEADERLFMNGYQTWTYSPELNRNGKLRGTDHIPGFLRKKYAFDRYGDYHFAPYGHQKGQSHGFSYCYFRKGKQFRLVASLDEKPGYTILRYDSGKALLTLERDCAGVEHPGGSFPLLDLFFAEGGETEVFDGWFQAMGIKPRTEKKLAGYSSWYNRYQDITEDTIREDLTGCRSLLCLGDLFQIDDGWEPKVGDWLEKDAQKIQLDKVEAPVVQHQVKHPAQIVQHGRVVEIQRIETTPVAAAAPRFAVYFQQPVRVLPEKGRVLFAHKGCKP